MQLAQLAYLSNAVRPMTSDQLEQLVSQARSFNHARDITGILLYGDGHFMQLLEGPLHEVNQLYHRIRQDPRHEGVMQLTFHGTTGRIFPDWDMALVNLDFSQRVDRREFRDLVRTLAESDENRSLQIVHLLDHFRERLEEPQPVDSSTATRRRA